MKERHRRSRPDLSVVLWSAGHGERLWDILGAVRRQGALSLEIWMADFASKDGGVEFVRRNFPWVRVVCVDEKFPPWVSFFWLAARARAPWMFALSPFVVPPPGVFAEMLQEVRQRGNRNIALARLQGAPEGAWHLHAFLFRPRSVPPLFHDPEFWRAGGFWSAVKVWERFGARFYFHPGPAWLLHPEGRNFFSLRRCLADRVFSMWIGAAGPREAFRDLSFSLPVVFWSAAASLGLRVSWWKYRRDLRERSKKT